MHGLPEPSEPKVAQADVIDWVNKTLAEEWAGSPTGDLGRGEADQAFVRQVQQYLLSVRSLDFSFLVLLLALFLSRSPPPPPSIYFTAVTHAPCV